MNKENIKELLNQAKEAATTEEAKALVNDLESLVDLLNHKDKESKEFLDNVKNAQEKFLISLGKAASSLGLDADSQEGLFPKPEAYSPEELEKLEAIKNKLEESPSRTSNINKLRNHSKVRI